MELIDANASHVEPGLAERWAARSFEKRDALGSRIALAVMVSLLYGGTAYLRGDHTLTAVAITAIFLNVFYLWQQHGYNRLLERLQSLGGQSA